MLFLVSVFSNVDRTKAAGSAKSEGQEYRSGDFPFVDTETVKGLTRSVEWSQVQRGSTESKEEASGCYSRIPLNHLLKFLSV